VSEGAGEAPKLAGVDVATAAPRIQNTSICETCEGRETMAKHMTLGMENSNTQTSTYGSTCAPWSFQGSY
jgi:hypothetical protein